MSKIVKSAYFYPIILIFLGLLFRFWNYDLPPLMDPDSVKYTVPHSIVKAQNFEWIFGGTKGLVFSYFYKIFNYFIESLFNGSLMATIIIQKIMGIGSSLLIFYVANSICKNRVIAFIAALCFCLNPVILGFEDYLMTESLFLFLLNLAIALIFKLQEWNQNNTKLNSQGILIALSLSILLAIIPITKTVNQWSICVITGLFVFALIDFFINKKKPLLYIAIIIFSIWNLAELPIKLYNKEHFNNFAISAVPLGGSVLWDLSEERLKKIKSEPKWLTETMLNLTKQFKIRRGVALDAKDHGSYTSAVTLVTVRGREGKFINPVTGKRMSPKEFSDTVKKYYRSALINDPKMAMEIFFKGFSKSYFPSKVATFNYFKRSNRKGASFELANTFLRIPHSYTETFPPQVKDLPALRMTNVREDGWYKDSGLKTKYKNAVPLAWDMHTDRAFLYQKQSLHIFWVNLFKHFFWSSALVILFLLGIVKFLFSKGFQNLNLFNYFILGHGLFFVVGSMATMGLYRYGLYSISALILFSVIAFYAKEEA